MSAIVDMKKVPKPRLVHRVTENIWPRLMLGVSVGLLDRIGTHGRAIGGILIPIRNSFWIILK